MRFREKYAIQPGKQIEQIEVNGGILIRPAELAENWKRISARVEKKWPKKTSSVQAIREDREQSLL